MRGYRGVRSYRERKLIERTRRAQGFIRINLRSRITSLEATLDLLRWSFDDVQRENHELRLKLARRWWRRGS